jgi:hypothetical protein
MPYMAHNKNIGKTNKTHKILELQVFERTLEKSVEIREICGKNLLV